MITSEWKGVEHFKIHDFSHIEFFVGNAKQAVHFYRSIFGFQAYAYSGPETGNKEFVSYVLKNNKIYFVIDLNKRKRDIRKLINNIQNCIIDILQEFKIKSYPDRNNIGIWVKDKNNYMKIAAIGIRVKKWIAYHGFALNVSNDLTKYKKIVPCGIKDKGITSLKNMGIRNYENINEIIEKKFLSTFL